MIMLGSDGVLGSLDFCVDSLGPYIQNLPYDHPHAYLSSLTHRLFDVNL
jgi:hypothetical protein